MEHKATRERISRTYATFKEPTFQAKSMNFNLLISRLKNCISHIITLCRHLIWILNALACSSSPEGLPPSSFGSSACLSPVRGFPRRTRRLKPRKIKFIRSPTNHNFYRPTSSLAETSRTPWEISQGESDLSLIFSSFRTINQKMT